MSHQNPNNPAPQEILDAQRLVSVEYVGFDGAVHQGGIVVNESVVEDMRKFFALALDMKFPIKSVVPISDPKYKWSDELSCGDNNSSGFNYRTVTASPDRLSMHATGMAFDINPVQNIYIKYGEDSKEVFRFPETGVYDPDAPGTLTSAHPLVALMKNLGWEWGGDWTAESGRVDYQHFEKRV